MRATGSVRSELAVIYERDPEELRTTIEAALRAESGHVTNAARRLSVSRPFLWYYLRKLGMNRVPQQIRDERIARFRLPPIEEVTRGD